MLRRVAFSAATSSHLLTPQPRVRVYPNPPHPLLLSPHTSTPNRKPTPQPTLGQKSPPTSTQPSIRSSVHPSIRPSARTSTFFDPESISTAACAHHPVRCLPNRAHIRWLHCQADEEDPAAQWANKGRGVANEAVQAVGDGHVRTRLSLKGPVPASFILPAGLIFCLWLSHCSSARPISPSLRLSLTPTLSLLPFLLPSSPSLSSSPFILT